jgi:hypothetical protein
MSLYKSEDSNDAKASVEATLAADASGATVVFIDATEAGLDANRERGLVSPGWWSYQTYTDAAGTTRHKAECLVNIQDPEANASETQADDAIAADTAVTISVTAQPADVTGAADPYTGNFVVNATATGDATGATISVQWQKQTATGTRWTNVSTGGVYGISTATSGGARVGTLAITAADKSDLDGYKFRAKLTTSTGASEVTSDYATLTFA